MSVRQAGNDVGAPEVSRGGMKVHPIVAMQGG